MANFNTHLSVAAASAGLLGTLCLKAGYVGVADAFMLSAACTTGGLLPDIDLKYSHPAKLMFSLLGAATALLFMFGSQLDISIVSLWFVGLCIYLAVRYPLWMLFHRFAVHRGSIHSVVAAVLAALLTAAVSYRLFGKPAFVAWLSGLAMFIGYIVHLVLDEIYSVDFMNYRVKRTFGTALKVMDLKHISGSCAIIAGCAITWFYTPSPVEFWQTLVAEETRQILYQRLLPDWMTDFARSIWQGYPH